MLWRFRSVTLPMLSPITFFLVVTSLLNSFQAFDIIKVMTEGGPVDATNTLIYYVYEQGFVAFNAGRAAAAALVLFVIMFGITLIQLRYAEDAGSTMRSRQRQRRPRLGDRLGAATALPAMALALSPSSGCRCFWMLLGSLKTNQEIYTFPPPWLPTEWRCGRTSATPGTRRRSAASTSTASSPRWPAPGWS